jgi:hypothetical protein
MGQKIYVPIAVIVFLLGTAGADLVARTSIGGETFGHALNEHVYYACVEAIGTILLLVPFIAVALVCARAEKRARTRSVGAIFALAMITLFYFYFEGYQGSQYAMLERKWTAAALAIGLLPFFIGIPVVGVVMGVGALAGKYDRRV